MDTHITNSPAGNRSLGDRCDCLAGPPQRRWSGHRSAGRLVLAMFLALAALVLVSCNLFQPQEPQLPVPLAKLIPDSWQVVELKGSDDGIQSISVDRDADPEWLIFFNYDNVPDAGLGPIGGVIYDPQQDTIPYDPQTLIPFPYQPSAFLVPYRLLPDWRKGKGQGYLGNASVTYEQTGFVQPRRGEEPVYDELVVSGLNAGGAVTRVSIFWWQSPAEGYGVFTAVGDHHITVADREPNTPVRKLTAYQNLDERSNFCRIVVYERQGSTHQFSETPPAIGFCQGNPEHPVPQAPTYPEAVVLAWLLQTDPDQRKALVAPNRRDALEALAPQLKGRVVSVTYDSTAASRGVGNDAVSLMSVTTRIDGASGQQTYKWTLVEQRPTEVGQTAKWLIDDVRLQP